MPHLMFTLLTALLLAAARAALDNRSPRQRLHLAAGVFINCVIAIVAGGWLMHFIHG